MSRIEPFEKYHQQYEDWFVKNKSVYESELRAIRTLLPQKGEGLEIGVGTGRFAARLGIKQGLEPSEMMGKYARERGIQVSNGVAENLPYSESQFDFALMVTTICFVDDIELSLQEAYRVLRVNGSLIIGFIDKESPVGKTYQKYKNDSVFYRAATFYSVRDVMFYLDKVGFQDFASVQTIFHDLSEIQSTEPIKAGYGEGSFVALKAVKRAKCGQWKAPNMLCS
jgi:ubiquinone/menaquinone biosynthesis C-methylase UbiE